MPDTKIENVQREGDGKDTYMVSVEPGPRSGCEGSRMWSGIMTVEDSEAYKGCRLS